MLIFAGLRPGEALALRWVDIDFHEGLIKVRRHVNRFGVGLPKTSSSERDVVMLRPVKRALQEQRARSQLRSELVFVNENGKNPFDLDNLRQRNWIRLLHRAGLRHRPLYQCRHTYATLLLRAGEDMRFVASQMGHTTLAMLIRHYARWSRRSPAGGNAINRLLEDSELAKMPEFCQKTEDGGDPPPMQEVGKGFDFPREFTGAGDRFRTDDLVLGNRRSQETLDVSRYHSMTEKTHMAQGFSVTAHVRPNRTGGHLLIPMKGTTLGTTSPSMSASMRLLLPKAKRNGPSQPSLKVPGRMRQIERLPPHRQALVPKTIDAFVRAAER